MDIDEINSNLMEILKKVSEIDINPEFRNIFLDFCEQIIMTEKYPIYVGLDDLGKPKRFNREFEGFLTINKINNLDQMFDMFNSFMNSRKYILEKLESMK